MDREEKSREVRLRMKAKRQGLYLSKSRRRDPDSIDYGRYSLSRLDNNAHVFGAENYWQTATLDEIEAFLTRASR